MNPSKIERKARHGRPEDVRSGKARSDAVSFTVPASGRRYQIHIEDWESIKLHMAIADAARNEPKNNPPQAK